MPPPDYVGIEGEISLVGSWNVLVLYAAEDHRGGAYALNDHGVCARGTRARNPARGPTPPQIDVMVEIPELAEVTTPGCPW